MLKWFQTSQTLAIGGQNTLAVKTWGFDRFDLVRSILAMRIAIGDAHRLSGPQNRPGQAPSNRPNLPECASHE